MSWRYPRLRQVGHALYHVSRNGTPWALFKALFKKFPHGPSAMAKRDIISHMRSNQYIHDHCIWMQYVHDHYTYGRYMDCRGRTLECTRGSIDPF